MKRSLTFLVYTAMEGITHSIELGGPYVHMMIEKYTIGNVVKSLDTFSDVNKQVRVSLCMPESVYESYKSYSPNDNWAVTCTDKEEYVAGFIREIRQRVDTRLSQLSECGVKNIWDYEEMAEKDQRYMHLGYRIYTVIDADKILTPVSKELQQELYDILKRARAVGVYLILTGDKMDVLQESLNNADMAAQFLKIMDTHPTDWCISPRICMYEKD